MALPIIPNSIAEAAKDFLQKVITPPLEQVGDLLADQVKYYRFKNQVTILNKAEAYIKRKNIKTKKISLKVLTPMLEYGSLEEDESLQDKWAALLANTAAEDSKIESTIYGFILSQLTRTDAEALQMIYNFCQMKPANKNPLRVNFSAVHDLPDSFYISVDNLFRLRVIREYGASGMHIVHGAIFTPLGIKFMEVTR